MHATLAAEPTLRIGSVALRAPVLVSPMVGITDAPTRALTHELGAGLVSTEMERRSPITLALMRPVASSSARNGITRYVPAAPAKIIPTTSFRCRSSRGCRRPGCVDMCILRLASLPVRSVGVMAICMISDYGVSQAS